MTSIKDDKFKPVQIVCLGTVILKGGKKGIAYGLLDGDRKETGDKMYFSIMKSTKGSAGMVYDARYFDNTIMGITYFAPLNDMDRKAAIKIASQATEVEYQTMRQQKKAELDDTAILELLKPLRDAYRSTNGIGRGALIARVILIMQRL